MYRWFSAFAPQDQPPSGGCVLKLPYLQRKGGPCVPAAFGRLRVETMKVAGQNSSATQPPSGGCVLKLMLLGVF